MREGEFTSAEVKDKVYKHSHKTAWGLKRKGMTAIAELKIMVNFVFLCFNCIFVSSVSYMMREDSKAVLTYDHCLYPAILNWYGHEHNKVYSLSMSVWITFHCVYFRVCVDVSLTQIKVGHTEEKKLHSVSRKYVY